MPTKPRILDTLEEYILSFGTEDWVDVRVVAEAVAYELGLEERPELVRELSIRLISDLVGDGYFAAGELGTTGFEAWGVTGEEAINRIEQRWRALGERLPGIDEVAWLDLTELGEQRAEKVNHEALDTLDFLISKIHQPPKAEKNKSCGRG